MKKVENLYVIVFNERRVIEDMFLETYETIDDFNKYVSEALNIPKYEARNLFRIYSLQEFMEDMNDELLNNLFTSDFLSFVYINSFVSEIDIKITDYSMVKDPKGGYGQYLVIGKVNGVDITLRSTNSEAFDYWDDDDHPQKQDNAINYINSILERHYFDSEEYYENNQ